MECLWLIFGLTAVVLLISIFSNLNQLRKETKLIMSNQTDFNEKIDRANVALESIAVSVTSEAQQIREFIASLPPEVDTSALDGVIARLEGVAGSVGTIFEPTADEDGGGDEPDDTTDDEPVDEPPPAGDSGDGQ